MILFAAFLGIFASLTLNVIVLHWLFNVIAAFYGIKLMSYPVAMAVTGLLWMMRGLSLSFGKENK